MRLYLAILASIFFVACSDSDLGKSSSPNSDNAPVGTPDPADPNPPPSPTPNPGPTPPPAPNHPSVPTTMLENENIGTKRNVGGVFNRWTLKSTVTGGRGSQYAEVTAECHGLIELDMALTAEQWKDPAQKKNYYRNVDNAILVAGEQVLADHGNPLTGTEKQNFLLALKALSWQESRWQHYMRYKDWFFVIVSGGSYNALDDWGITQVARSGFNARDLLNPEFFEDKGYCSLSATLEYGFQEYFDAYMEARTLSCNSGDPMLRILGAYNRYSSGYSSCHNGYSSDAAYKAYQVAAMAGIKTHYLGQPWKLAP